MASIEIPVPGQPGRTRAQLPVVLLDPATGEAISASTPLSVSLVGGSAGVDREVVLTTYVVKTAFTGASVGDTITCVRVLNVTTSTPSTDATIWRNDTTNTDFGTAPSAANLTLVGAGGATDAVLQDVRARIGAGSASPDASPTTTTGSLITALKGLWAWMVATVATEATTAAMSAKLPSALGPQAHSNSLSITPAQSGTATVSAPATSMTSVLLRGATTARKSLTIQNDSASVLYILLSAGTASPSNYSLSVQPGDALFIGLGEYQGAVNGVLAAGTGTARVTEVT